MPTNLRISIGTLYCGENEFDRSQQALRDQDYTHWTQFVIRDLPEKQAHEALYARFMEQSKSCDLFLKLDADMVLTDARRLSALAMLFDQNAALSHAVMAVRDWSSQSLIMGVHAYRSDTTWRHGQDQLFVDDPPRITGQRRYYYRHPAPLAMHSPDPSPMQAFHFGLHRALKVAQPKRPTFRVLYSATQMRLLRRTWRHYEATRDHRLAMTILGAHVALQGACDASCINYRSDAFGELWQQYASWTEPQIHELVEPAWHSTGGATARWLRQSVAAAAARRSLRL